MTNAEIKRLYDGKLTLWTGVQCETLVRGTREQLENEIIDNIRTQTPGGGFFFGSTNSVQFGGQTDH